MFFGTVLLLAGISQTYAWNSEQQATANIYGEKPKLVLVELELRSYEKQRNSAVGSTAFYLYKANGTQVGGRYITDKNGKISLYLPFGSYYFEQAEPAIGYTYDTDEEGNQITKYPFDVTEEDEAVTVKVNNIQLYGNLQIRKTVRNEDESPLTDDQKKIAFSFTVTFSDGGSYEYQIDGGEKQQITSGSTLQLCHGQTAVFEDLPIGLLYTVTEAVNGNYITESTANRGNVTEDVSIAHFISNYNTMPLPTDKTTTLTVTKQLDGEILESDRQKEFDMILTVNGESTEFTLKADESKSFEIPVGATYEVCEKDYISDGLAQSIVNGTGTATELPIDVTVVNTYIGVPRIEMNGTITWNMGEYTNIVLPDSITLQLKNDELLLEEKVVTPNEEGVWQYTFIAPKYNADGSEAEYTIVEMPLKNYRVSYNGYDITNIYIAPLEVELPTITKVVEGKDAPRTEFEYVFEGTQEAPMPSDSVGNQKRLKYAGEGEFEIGNITFTEPGTYVYSVSELNGGKNDWKYDTAVYTVTFTVTETNHMLSYETMIMKNENKSESIIFINTYEPETVKTIQIHGSIKWVHGDNPENSQPTSIVVYLYANGKLAAQRLVTASEDWEYRFEMPQFDKSGNEIIYTIDEAKVENYEKQIMGFDLLNTYIGETKNPASPNDTTDTDVPQSGDNTNILVWFALVMATGVLLILNRIDKKRTNG